MTVKLNDKFLKGFVSDEEIKAYLQERHISYKTVTTFVIFTKFFYVNRT